MKTLLFAAAMAFAFTACTEHKTQTEKASHEAVQDAKIEAGAASGELTESEENRLKQRQEHVDGMMERAAADDTVTRAEHNRIERAQDKIDNAISRKTHNARHK